MSEIRPQITYTPEGVLRVTPEFDIEPKYAKKQMAEIEQLEERWSATIEDTNEGIQSISIELERALGDFDFPPQKHTELDEFLRAIHMLLPYAPDDSIDRVLGLNTLNPFGATANIYHQFQRWLNNDGVNEETALESILAMAVPFGKEHIQKAKKRFSWDGVNARSTSFGLSVADGFFRNFNIDEVSNTDEAYLSRSGEATWPWVDLSTLGSCACWGVNGDERTHLLIDGNTKRLYQMAPHNVDMSHQSLSLVLGIGVLAHKAIQYEGTEDVFAEVQWSEIKTHPKTPR